MADKSKIKKRSRHQLNYCLAIYVGLTWCLLFVDISVRLHSFPLISSAVPRAIYQPCCSVCVFCCLLASNENQLGRVEETKQRQLKRKRITTRNDNKHEKKTKQKDRRSRRHPVSNYLARIRRAIAEVDDGAWMSLARSKKTSVVPDDIQMKKKRKENNNHVSSFG